MNELTTYLTSLAETKIATNSTATKVEQKASREIKENATALLCNALAIAFKDNSSVSVMRTSEGIGLAIDNEIGFIPLEISISVKSLDYDISEENIAYLEHLKEVKEKAEAKAKAKSDKIKADTERRAKAKAQKEAKGE